MLSDAHDRTSRRACSEIVEGMGRMTAEETLEAAVATRARLNATERRIVAICFLTAMIDGFDSLILAGPIERQDADQDDLLRVHADEGAAGQPV
jgi:hypothetical protein